MKIALLYELRPDFVPIGKPADLYSEFETIETIQAIVLGLEDAGHTVHLVDYQSNPLDELLRLRAELDLVLNCAVGIGSRFRELMPAALCEALRLPYTGSDPMAQALSASKHVSKLIALRENIATPDWLLVDSASEALQQLEIRKKISRDVVIKPVYEGSSIGIVGPINPRREPGRFVSLVTELVDIYAQPLLVEDFVAGYEITAPVLGNPPRPLTPQGLYLDGTFDLGHRIFDAQAKAEAPSGVWRNSLDLDPQILKTVQLWACRIHKALGCRDLSRSDFRVSSTGEIFFLEINATPQIAPHGSSFSAAAAAEGVNFQGLLSLIVSAAISRYPK